MSIVEKLCRCRKACTASGLFASVNVQSDGGTASNTSMPPVPGSRLALSGVTLRAFTRTLLGVGGW